MWKIHTVLYTVNAFKEYGRDGRYKVAVQQCVRTPCEAVGAMVGNSWCYGRQSKSKDASARQTPHHLFTGGDTPWIGFNH